MSSASDNVSPGAHWRRSSTDGARPARTASSGPVIDTAVDQPGMRIVSVQGVSGVSTTLMSTRPPQG
jgi:hypothetical protein